MDDREKIKEIMARTILDTLRLRKVTMEDAKRVAEAILRKCKDGGYSIELNN